MKHIKYLSAMSEFAIWRQQVENETPKNATEAFVGCNEEIFPTLIGFYYIILITSPVTTA